MEDSSTKNKRIFKNTMFMYGRMFVMLIISLFTARIVFNTLGVEDYGTYGVVGSIIVFFSFINRGLNSSTSRYILADIADNDIEKGRRTFCICLQAHMLIAIAILVLAETIGLWAVNYILKIPEGREFAANVVYQFSVISTVVGIMQSPFSATITAYERMDIYAYFSILDVVFRLLIIYLVQALSGDKLIVYGILVFVVSLINIAINIWFVRHKFEISHFRWTKDVQKLKDIFKFMTWSTLGQAAVVGTNQGASVLVNVYFSVVANAAMSISNAITGTVDNFVSNFQTAFRPQITKSYVTKENEYLNNLMLRSSKISSFLVIIFFVPIIFEVENVLFIWLGKDYPVLAPDFCRWTLIGLYFEALVAPLWMVMYAQTNIKNYQIVVSSIYSLNFFVGWLVYFLGGAAYSIIVVRCCVFFVLMFVRLFFVRTIFPQFSASTWVYEIVGRGILIIVISSLCTGLFSHFLQAGMLVHIILVTIFSLAVSGSLIYYFGMNKVEREWITQLIIAKIKR